MHLPPRTWYLLGLLAVHVFVTAARGGEAARNDFAGTGQSRATNYHPAAQSPLAPDHPLASVLDYARREQLSMSQTVRDFTCRLVKRERIEGVLQDYQFIDMRVREEQSSGGRVVKPQAIFLHFLAPANVARRNVLYVAGQNGGKMLVRNGGKHFDYVIAKLDPYGEAARKESLVPITESGFNRVLSQMILILERHAQIDPTGQNTRVTRIATKINDQPCSTIRVTHPRQQPGLEFHVANVFIDDALRVPVRVDISGWSRNPDQPNPVIAEYTYTNLELNVNLTDADFNPALLNSR